MLELTNEERSLIASRIKEIRTDNGLTLKEMGVIMQISDATASRYETGQVDNIPLPRIKALARKYGINPAWILGMSDKKNLNGRE